MYKRIVVKLGTSVLTGGGRDLDRPHLVELVRQCAELHRAGHEVIITSSGARQMGRARLGFPEWSNNIINQQLFAAVGQPRLMLMWERFFDIYDIRVGQILLTRADVENRQRYINARDTFSALIKHRIIPIANENDAVVTEEIKVGDNDNLSALVAILTNADLLLMLTDQPGLFTADPRTDSSAQLISEVHKIDDSLLASAGDSGTGLGIGGMTTKLQAAKLARHAGVDVVICSGREPDVIRRVADGAALGTRFPAPGNPVGKSQAMAVGRPQTGRHSGRRRRRHGGVESRWTQPAPCRHCCRSRPLPAR